MSELFLKYKVLMNFVKIRCLLLRFSVDLEITNEEHYMHLLFIGDWKHGNGNNELLTHVLSPFLENVTRESRQN